jgi:hypothetical protein
MKSRSLNELRQVKDTVYRHPYNSRTTYSNEETRSIAIEFSKWMRENDTPENAERWFGFTDNDMFDAFIDEYWKIKKNK